MGRIPQWCGWLGLTLAALAAGCATTGTPQLPICPGKASAADALAALSARAEQAVPLRVSGGQCRLEYYVPEDEDPKRHNLTLQIWFHPPSQMYIQGAIAVDSKGLIVGCNEEEFWLALRPKEMNAYYWGQWDEAANVEGLVISPQIVLEAFGIIVRHSGDDTKAWSLTNEGPYDILTLKNEAGETRKRVYIYTCDYLVRKIEYFDDEGRIAARAELDEYEPVTDDFVIPTKMMVTAFGLDGRPDVADIKLVSIREKELSERARQKVFARDPEDVERFDRVYRYENGKWTTLR